MNSDRSLTTPDAASSAVLSILCVCTGNIARSPVAARLLQLATDHSVNVASAGTGAVVGAGVDPAMVSLLNERGIDAGDFRARDLDERLLEQADLVLCLDAGHRRRVVELVPTAMRRTFSLRELARLVASECDPSRASGPDDATRIRAAVAAVLPYRGGLGSADADDVADPHRHGAAAYRAAFDDIARAIATIAGAVRLRGTEGLGLIAVPGTPESTAVPDRS